MRRRSFWREGGGKPRKTYGSGTREIRTRTYRSATFRANVLGTVRDLLFARQAKEAERRGHIILCDNWHHSYCQTATSDCKTPQHQRLFRFALRWGPGVLVHRTAVSIVLLLFWTNGPAVVQSAPLLMSLYHTQRPTHTHTHTHTHTR